MAHAARTTSSVQVATTRSTRGAIAALDLDPAAAGSCRASPWWRRLTTPSAWKVCTTGMPSARAARRARRGPTSRSARARRRAARPPTARAARAAKAPMYGSSSSFGHVARRARRRRGRRRRPGASGTRRGSAGSSRRVCTTTSSPRRAERRGERGDVDVLPAGVDAAEHGERAGVLGDHGDPHRPPPPPGRRPSRRGSGRARSARAPPRGPRAPRSARLLGVVDQPRARAPASTSTPRRDHAGLGGHRLVDLGRAERDDRHAEVHRLQQREAERRPADRVQVDAPAGHLRVQLVLRQVLDAARALAASMPKRSSGAAAAKRSSRSVPVTRARRRASLMTTAARGELARVARRPGRRCRARSRASASRRRPRRAR